MQESLYFSLAALSAVYFFTRFRITQFSFLVFLIFWEGLFEYYGLFIPGLWNSYKVVVFLTLLILVINTLPPGQFINERRLNTLYVLFVISFIITHIFIQGSFITLLSQFFYKYSSLFLIYYLVKGLFVKQRSVVYFKNMLLSVIAIQIFLSITKMFIFGLAHEPNVGSVEFGSGGKAVVLPIVILFFYYLVGLKRDTLQEKMFYILPLIIALASGKRTPVFLFPVYLLWLLSVFDGRRKMYQSLKYIPIVLILLYLGIRTNKSLNPEKSNWGTFDFDYVLSYALDYNFGTENFSEISNNQYTSGRGGSFFLLFDPDRLGLNKLNEILFGKGVLDAALSNEDRFIGGGIYNIQHAGLMGGASVELYSLGYFGFLITLLIYLLVLQKIKSKNLKWIIISFFLFEFLFYANQMLLTLSPSILIIFGIFYYNEVMLIKDAKR